jgi:hypothetical protein
MNGRQMVDAARVLRPGLKNMTEPFAMDDLARKIREVIERRDWPDGTAEDLERGVGTRPFCGSAPMPRRIPRASEPADRL